LHHICIKHDAEGHEVPALLVTPNWANRRFNERYPGGETVFGEPDALLTAAPDLLGTDGTEMSESRSDAIELRASEDDTVRRGLIRTAETDIESV